VRKKRPTTNGIADLSRIEGGVLNATVHLPEATPERILTQISHPGTILRDLDAIAT
jgi:hypothetical protein